MAYISIPEVGAIVYAIAVNEDLTREPMNVKAFKVTENNEKVFEDSEVVFVRFKDAKGKKWFTTSNLDGEIRSIQTHNSPGVLYYEIL